MEEHTFSEDLAIAIQTDISKILAMMGTMATKEEVGLIRQDVATIMATMATKEDIRQLREEVDGIKGTMATTMATKEDLRKYATFSDVREIVSDAKNEILREIDPLRIRISRVEEKVGIVPATR